MVAPGERGTGGLAPWQPPGRAFGTVLTNRPARRARTARQAAGGAPRRAPEGATLTRSGEAVLQPGDTQSTAFRHRMDGGSDRSSRPSAAHRRDGSTRRERPAKRAVRPEEGGSPDRARGVSLIRPGVPSLAA